MKLIHLIAIALIIIIPMALLLTNYSNAQLKTLENQISYDQKLNSSTYDAVKAFQLNMSNSSTSNIVNSKIRDIEASINVFYTSLASNFSSSGYSQETLKNYTPAIVYTLYDGYYIYSAYDNTLTNTDVSSDTQYSPGERLYGLKPYIYYSCRYKPHSSSDTDFVITYSLDSYITIQGTLEGKPINKSGYLLTGVEKSGDKYTYRGIEIVSESGENLRENIYIEDYNDTSSSVHVEGEKINAKHIKVNGSKYYIEDNKTSTDDIFYMMNEDRIAHTTQNVTVDEINTNTLGIQYYKEAYEFKEFILGNSILRNLSTSDAVDINGNYYNNDGPYTSGINIFQELNNINTNNSYIEDKDSDFYLHRTEVIKTAIESNLIVAIDNYNKVSESSAQFAMPKLTDNDWESLTNGISVISFLQGLNIGGKMYNGYSIVSNDINNDYVGENSIYIVAGDKYYLPTDSTLNSLDLTSAVGVLNTNFELKTIKDTIGNDEGTTEQFDVNYYPREEAAAYTSVVNPGSSANNKESVDEYMKKLSESTDTNQQRIAQIYYTALGRERYGMYRVNNDVTTTGLPTGIAPHGRGDINDDGVINVVDLQMCLHHISGRNILTGDSLERADVNGDGNVDATDLQELTDYI